MKLYYNESIPNKTNDKEEESIIRLPCRQCRSATTKHQVLTRIDTSGDNGEFLWWEEHVTIQCNSCEAISFLHKWWLGDDVQYNYDLRETIISKHQTRYPPCWEHPDFTIVEEHELPYHLQNLYKETYCALYWSLLVFAAMGIRKMVEIVCKDQGIAEWTLKAKVDQLVQKQFITTAQWCHLHQVRDLGNDAAHDLLPITMQKAEGALGVVEHLLRQTYVIPNSVKKNLKIKNTP